MRNRAMMPERARFAESVEGIRFERLVRGGAKDIHANVGAGLLRIMSQRRASAAVRMRDRSAISTGPDIRCARYTAKVVGYKPPSRVAFIRKLVEQRRRFHSGARNDGARPYALSGVENGSFAGRCVQANVEVYLYAQSVDAFFGVQSVEIKGSNRRAGLLATCQARTLYKKLAVRRNHLAEMRDRVLSSVLGVFLNDVPAESPNQAIAPAVHSGMVRIVMRRDLLCLARV